MPLQEKQQAVEAAAATTAATSTPRQKAPAQPTDEDQDTPGSNPPRPKVPKTQRAAKPMQNSEVQSDQRQEAKGRVTCAL